MQYIDYYDSSLGEIIMVSDGKDLISLAFKGQKYDQSLVSNDCKQECIPVLAQTRKWLDLYFSGQKPNFIPEISIKGTVFQECVWKLISEIPYGRTVTYGEIARNIAAQRNKKSMSAQAVGAAVGRNPISIIIPCHRVIGHDGNLTGYAGGIWRKTELLKIEHAYKDYFYIPDVR